jgi:hypothetical protein
MIASKQASAVVTFPNHPCSNGLSGVKVRNLARKYFRVREKSVQSKFSTLGGRKTATKHKKDRYARLQASELILVLQPKPL